jgi:hypothetical protein
VKDFENFQRREIQFGCKVSKNFEKRRGIVMTLTKLYHRNI